MLAKWCTNNNKCCSSSKSCNKWVLNLLTKTSALKLTQWCLQFSEVWLRRQSTALALLSTNPVGRSPPAIYPDTSSKATITRIGLAVLTRLTRLWVKPWTNFNRKSRRRNNEWPHQGKPHTRVTIQQCQLLRQKTQQTPPNKFLILCNEPKKCKENPFLGPIISALEIKLLQQFTCQLWVVLKLQLPQIAKPPPQARLIIRVPKEIRRSTRVVSWQIQIILARK